jgi:hypothetical protein
MLLRNYVDDLDARAAGRFSAIGLKPVREDLAAPFPSLFAFARWAC